MAGEKRAMPLPGARDAPTFNPRVPREVGRFFNIIGRTFAHCGVTDDKEKKQWVYDYADIETGDSFMALKEFEGTKLSDGEQVPYSYDEFKEAALKLFPGASEASQTFVLADLTKLAQDMRVAGDYAPEVLATYNRVFATRFTFLERSHIASESQAIQIYVTGFPTAQLDRLWNRLQVIEPMRKATDPYTLTSVMEAATHIYHPNNLFPFQMDRIPANDSYPGASALRPSNPARLKAEELSSEALALLKLIANAATNAGGVSAQQQVPSRPPAQQGGYAPRAPAAYQGQGPQGGYRSNPQGDFQRNEPARNAFQQQPAEFCMWDGCQKRISTCDGVARYIESGHIRRDERGRVVLSTGAWIPSTPAHLNMEGRMLHWHEQHPGQLAKAQLNYSAAAYEGQLQEEARMMEEHQQLMLLGVEGSDAVEHTVDVFQTDLQRPGKYHLTTRERESFLVAELLRVREQIQLEGLKDTEVQQASVNQVGTRRNPGRASPPPARRPPLPRGQAAATTPAASAGPARLSGPPPPPTNPPAAPPRPPTPGPAPTPPARTRSPPPPTGRQGRTEPRRDDGPAHPFRNVDGATFGQRLPQPPPARPTPPVVNEVTPQTTGQPRPATNYRNVAPANDTEASRRLFESMLSQQSTHSNRDLISAAPGLRDALKDFVTKKRVAIEVPTAPRDGVVNRDQAPADMFEINGLSIFEVSASDDVEPLGGDSGYPDGSHIADEYASALEYPTADVFIQEVCEGGSGALEVYEANELEVDGAVRRPGILPIVDPAEILKAGKAEGSIRAIKAVVNNAIEVYPILDPGAQIVAMSRACAMAAGVMWDRNRTIQLQSANAALNTSLGLARNVPFNIGGIVVYLQCHITNTTAYDVLLGRPFDILTRSVVENLDGDHSLITIHDPNHRGRSLTVPTCPRRQTMFRMSSAPEVQTSVETEGDAPVDTEFFRSRALSHPRS